IVSGRVGAVVPPTAIPQALKQHLWIILRVAGNRMNRVWLLLDGLPMPRRIEAARLFGQMEVPVFVEVAAEVQRPQPNHRLPAFQSPAPPRTLHPVFDQILAR